MQYAKDNKYRIRGCGGITPAHFFFKDKDMTKSNKKLINVLQFAGYDPCVHLSGLPAVILQRLFHGLGPHLQTGND